MTCNSWTGLIFVSLTMLPLVAAFTSKGIQVAPNAANRLSLIRGPLQPVRSIHATRLQAKPKRGAVVDSYRTVSVNCAKCQERLFRYKKKNGTKSNLIKCYVERIAEDTAGVLQKAKEDISDGKDFPQELPQDYSWECPNCYTQFARSAQIHGLPALKMVGGKIKMTKK